MDVHTFRGALPDALTEALRQEGPALGALPNHWLPATELSKPRSERALRTLAEACVAEAFDRVVAARLPAGWAGAEGSGVEWWCQHRGNEGMSFHIDKDELLMKSDGSVSTPILSSIIYLNQASGDDDAGAGAGSVEEGAEEAAPAPTLICDQWWDTEQHCLTPAIPTRSALIFPAFGRLALFRGDLAHGVLQSGFQVSGDAPC